MTAPTSITVRSPKSAGWKWSIVSFACPLLAVSAAYAIASLVTEEEVSVYAIFISWLLLGAVLLVAIGCAFARRERARWATLLALVLMFIIVFGGVSVG